MSLGERMKIARESTGKGQKEMAQLCNASYRMWQAYEVNDNQPKAEVIESLVKLGFNANWLLTGEGEMKRGTTVAGPATASATSVSDPGEPFAQDAESEELCRLLKRYGNRALVEDVKARLLKIKAVVEG